MNIPPVCVASLTVPHWSEPKPLEMQQIFFQKLLQIAEQTGSISEDRRIGLLSQYKHVLNSFYLTTKLFIPVG